MRLANFIMIGPLKKYRSIQAETIASAMQILSKRNYLKSIIESEEIKEIVSRN